MEYPFGPRTSCRGRLPFYRERGRKSHAGLMTGRRCLLAFRALSGRLLGRSGGGGRFRLLLGLALAEIGPQRFGEAGFAGLLGPGRALAGLVAAGIVVGFVSHGFLRASGRTCGPFGCRHVPHMDPSKSLRQPVALQACEARPAVPFSARPKQGVPCSGHARASPGGDEQGPCSSVVEHTIGNGEVECSIHSVGTTSFRSEMNQFFNNWNLAQASDATSFGTLPSLVPMLRLI